ncbi:MAG: enoyl-CoA hydratase/isomerase family protein [Chloroflexi bacterium]|nr:enoyl-CoA hydratase/isomerase family protein [Chloroflexota bacterium]
MAQVGEKVEAAKWQDLIYEKKGEVCWITFNRPHRLNTFTGQTWRELHEALVEASHDTDVGIIVMTGAEKEGYRPAFSAGGDQSERETPEYLTFPMVVMRDVRDSIKPVIAAVNGYAIGGGHWLHVICDLSIASDNASFGQAGPRVGSPASGYVVSHLAQVIGMKRAKEVWMLCRRYDAKAALQWGLVNAVVPHDQLMAEVDKWCDDLLNISPTCLMAVKESFNQVGDYLLGSQPTTWIDHNFHKSEEAKEAVTAFFEKRKPDFRRFRR